MDGWMDGWMEGWKDGRMDGWMDGTPNKPDKLQGVTPCVNQEHKRRAAANKDHQKRRKVQQNREKGKELAKMHGRMTSGNLHLEGCARIDDPQILRMVTEKTKEKLAEEPRKAIRQHEKEKKMFDEAMELQESGKAEEDWSSKDHAFMIKFKLLGRSDSRETKKKQPSKKAELQEHWEELRNKQDPGPPQWRPSNDNSCSDASCFSSNDDINKNGTGPPTMTRGISADECRSEDGSDALHFSSDDESNGTGPPMMTRGISADEHSSDDGGDAAHFSSDEESNGTGPSKLTDDNGIGEQVAV
jgi:hypothetical protein